MLLWAHAHRRWEQADDLLSQMGRPSPFAFERMAVWGFTCVHAVLALPEEGTDERGCACPGIRPTQLTSLSRLLSMLFQPPVLCPRPKGEVTLMLQPKLEIQISCMLVTQLPRASAVGILTVGIWAGTPDSELLSSILEVTLKEETLGRAPQMC